MKTMFALSAAISGTISFFAATAYAKNANKKFDLKMDAVDNWYANKSS